MAGGHPGPGFRRAPAASQDHVIRQPIDVVCTAGRVVRLLNTGEAAVSGEATIAPVAANLFGEVSVKREAPPGQWLERCSVTPVQRQKATPFAGGRATRPRP